MEEFWEHSFRDKQAMWGYSPADIARVTAERFSLMGLERVLIPGFGYGRNAKPFVNNGLKVTGIEISKTAIAIAKEHFEASITIHHASVTDMPFDHEEYDGIFCYALIHLLDERERSKLIANCYRQLRPGGIMVFVAISTRDRKFGKGLELSRHRFLTKHKVELFFYDQEAVQSEFSGYVLVDTREIREPMNSGNNDKAQAFWYIECKKPVSGYPLL